MERHVLGESEARYVMTSDELKSLLEEEFGRGLDFNVTVTLPSSSYACVILTRSY